MKTAWTPEDISKCFNVMKQLRPHLSQEQFIESVVRMAKNHGYLLVYGEQEGEVVCVAGLRMAEWLHTGRYLEIEDFVTSDGYRSQGIGGNLFSDIVQFARENNCNQVRLVSGLKREKAHQFYIGNGMVCEAKYFSIYL